MDPSQSPRSLAKNISTPKSENDMITEAPDLSSDTLEKPTEKMESRRGIFATEGCSIPLTRHGRTNNWNFIWDPSQEEEIGIDQGLRESKPDQPANKNLTKKSAQGSYLKKPEVSVGKAATVLDAEYQESILELRERQLDRRERELDRADREIERRERELDRRQRALDQDTARWTMETQRTPHWQEAIEDLRNRMEKDLLAERKLTIEREAALEVKMMARVDEVLEKERQLYGVMRMSDNEVNDMVEDYVGHLMQNDDDSADRVRFQSLLYLSQQKLAFEVDLKPPAGSDSLSLAWRIALGPSVVTEDRYNKALELLKDKDLDPSTKKLMESRKALEYATEYTSHLRKEGTESSDYSFSLGRIPQEDYMESVERQSKQNLVEYEALKALVDFICPATVNS